MSDTWNGKYSWMEMFRAAGLDDEGMHAWHLEFERRFPERHEDFLRWLGLEETEVAAIRERFSE